MIPNRRLAAAVALVVAAQAAPAFAYVRTRTMKGSPVAWRETPRVMELAAPLPETVEAAGAQDAAIQAAAAWDHEANSCTDLSFSARASADAPTASGMDGRNTVAFFNEVWCHPTETEGGDCKDRRYSQQALALTTLFVLASSGKILEADVELNAVHYKWSTGEVQAGHQDLLNALTHEFGHVLGFDHTCALGGEDPNLPDNQNTPRGSCGGATQEQRDATMFPSTMIGDIERRSLSPDDIKALCDVYPPAESGGCGCRVARAHGTPTPVLAVAIGVCIAALRSRARRSRRIPERSGLQP